MYWCTNTNIYDYSTKHMLNHMGHNPRGPPHRHTDTQVHARTHGDASHARTRSTAHCALYARTQLHTHGKHARTRHWERWPGWEVRDTVARRESGGGGCIGGGGDGREAERAERAAAARVAAVTVEAEAVVMRLGRGRW